MKFESFGLSPHRQISMVTGPTLHNRKQSPREAELLAQGHTVSDEIRVQSQQVGSVIHLQVMSSHPERGTGKVLMKLSGNKLTSRSLAFKVI